MSELTEAQIESSDDELPEEVAFDASKSAALKSVKDALEAAKTWESTAFRHRALERMRGKHLFFTLFSEKRNYWRRSEKRDNSCFKNKRYRVVNTVFKEKLIHS